MYDISSKIDILKNLKILYIEDEIKIQKEVCKTLELLAKDIYPFSNAEEALEFFYKNQVDIILSDVTLENMSGLEFAKKVRESNKTIPIIIISAHTDTEFLLKASKLKLVEYLVKPVNFNQLQNTLFNACEELGDVEITKIKFKNSIIFDKKKKVLIDNKEIVKLTNNELKFLKLLSKSKTPTSSQKIKSYIWDDPFQATDLALKSLLHKLRRKVGKDSIKNSSGIGYYLD